MSTTIPNSKCPTCGAELPGNAPQDLCPKCLLLGVAAPTEAGTLTEPRSAPPSREAVQAAFPQLEVVELIGQGGMGAVFRARQPKLNRFVALKILPENLARDPAFAERFAREGQMLARLHHPHIVTIHDFGQANGFFYLLMEYVDGVSLRQALRAGRFTPEQALAIVPMICEALQYAHDEGVLHRDIKPENILLDTKGRVRLVDFGIAKLATSPDPGFQTTKAEDISEGALTQAGSALGTANYMAPEQRTGPSTVDQRADIYSLGVVFYEMLTGELPVGRFVAPSRKTPLDPRVDEVVLRALEKQKEKRFGSAVEVKTCVEAITATPGLDQGSSGNLPQAAQSYPLPLSLLQGRVLLMGLVALIGLMLHQFSQSFRYLLPQLAFTARSGWVPGLVTLVGLAGIGWLAVIVWRKRHWFLAPFGTDQSPLITPSPPGVSSHRETARWLSLACLGVTVGLLVEILWILLGNLAIVAQSIANQRFLQCWYFLVASLLVIGLLIWWVKREVDRQDVGVPGTPPAWMPRAVLWGVGLALVGCQQRVLSNGLGVCASFSEFLAILSLAFLTRSRIWRGIAMAWMILILGSELLGMVSFLTINIRGGLPAEWTGQIGAIKTTTYFLIKQVLFVLCYAVGWIALLLPSSRAAFGIIKRTNQ